jgi:hypothetical protein
MRRRELERLLVGLVVATAVFIVHQTAALHYLLVLVDNEDYPPPPNAWNSPSAVFDWEHNFHQQNASFAFAFSDGDRRPAQDLLPAASQNINYNYNSMNSIRSWGCNRSETPLIFVHIGKAVSIIPHDIHK